MTTGIAPLAPSPLGPAGPTRADKLHEAAHDFESVMVKQLLKEAHVGGSDKASGYGDMAVDALSSAVEKGGGLGLAQQIEQALAKRP